MQIQCYINLKYYAIFSILVIQITDCTFYYILEECRMNELAFTTHKPSHHRKYVLN